MNDRFRVLRILSVVFKVIAWLFLILILVGAVGISVAARQAPAPQRVQAVVQIVIEGFWRFLVLYGLGEICRILGVIEAQTRKDKA